MGQNAKTGQWPAVRWRADRKKWEVDLGRVGGKRRRLLMDSEKQAMLYARQIRTEREARGRVALVELNPSQRADAVRALAVLRGTGSLEEAALAWMASRQTHAVTGPVVGVVDAVQRFCEAKRREGQRIKSVRSRESRLSTFAADVGDVPMREITADDVDAWLGIRKVGPVTANNYLTELHGFWAWCVREGLADLNVIDRVPRRKVERGVPAFLSVDACRVLMDAASTTPGAVPYFALCLFAGVRPAEAARLDLRSAWVDGEHIRIDGKVAKGRAARVIEAEPVLRAWLEGQNLGRVMIPRRTFEAVRRASAVPWGPDIMRHSFATYHVAMWGDAAKTALLMGHRDTGVLFAHYRGLTTKAEAKRFWGLLPPVNR